jgi:hypothetical protein
MGVVVDLDAVRTERQQRRRRLFFLAVVAVSVCTWWMRS